MKNNKELNAINPELNTLSDQFAKVSDEDLTLAAGAGDRFNEIEIGNITGFIGSFPSPQINEDPIPGRLPEGKVITGGEP